MRNTDTTESLRRCGTACSSIVSRRASGAGALWKLATMWARPRYSREAIARYQDLQLRRLVRHAWAQVPYYRRLLDGAGVKPEEFRGVEDLSRIPITRHRDLQQIALDDRLALGVDVSKCVRRATSGSTGEPIQIVRTRAEEHLLFGMRLRAQILSGLRPWDKRVKLGAAPDRLLMHRLGMFRMEHIERSLGAEESYCRLKSLGAQVIYGTPTTLDWLVRSIADDRLRELRPRLLFTGAEALSERTRKDLGRVFECPVVDFYGSHELNLMAWQCRHCGLYHTVDDSAVIEILGADGEPAAAGEDGQVVGTALHCYAMPVIRVEVGDIARRGTSKPGCPFGFGVIEAIRGRTVDYLPMPEGGLLNPHPMINAASETAGLLQFQIVQDSVNEVCVLFVGCPGRVDQIGREIQERLRPFLPSTIQLRVQAVDEIALTVAGKHRVVRALRLNSET